MLVAAPLGNPWIKTIEASVSVANASRAGSQCFTAEVKFQVVAVHL